jgi:hypothetical protein
MTQDDLMELIDELGLVSVVSLLATCCRDKAELYLRQRGRGSNQYTAWNSNAFLLRQMMTKLQPRAIMTLTPTPQVTDNEWVN